MVMSKTGRGHAKRGRAKTSGTAKKRAGTTRGKSKTASRGRKKSMLHISRKSGRVISPESAERRPQSEVIEQPIRGDRHPDLP